MKYPKLVPKCLCNTPIRIEIEQEEINEYGEPLEMVVIDTFCNYQDKARSILTGDKKLVTLSATALFDGDICDKLPTVSGGNAYIFGEKRRIYEGRKARNPDGTVNYTEVLLI